jgi:predicted NAD/FAD-dependent oxidoreductase
VVTVPTPQAKTLLGSATDTAVLDSVAYEPCWTLLWTPATLPANATEALVSEKPDAIAWWAREDLKPGRRGPPRFIIHASAAWSSEYLERPADQTAQRLVDIAARRLRIGTESHFQLAHRWRYAFASRPLGMGLVELSPQLIYASDACLGSRIELALASGRAAAESLSTTLALKTSSMIGAR